MCTPLSLFRRCRDDRRGSVAVMFALMLLLVISAVGGAIDYGRTMDIKAKMQTAADSGALVAANDPTMTEGRAAAEAERFFRAAVANIDPPIRAKFKAKRDKWDTGVTYTITADADVPTMLLGAVGFRKLAVDTVATASRSLMNTEIHALIDMSASMGIAADAANRDRMKAATAPFFPGGCAFACHRIEPSVPVPGTTYVLAKANGIRLREDVMNAAFTAFVDELMDPRNYDIIAGLRRMATYGFSDSMRVLAPPTPDATLLKASLLLFPNTERANTRFPEVMASITSALGTSGNGSPLAPRKVMLLVTDGVRWIFGTGGGPFDPALCRGLKSNGITVAVLEVRYFEDTGEANFETDVRPFYASITPALQECASQGYYFKVEDSADSQLNAAFVEVARAIRSKLSLTQ